MVKAKFLNFLYNTTIYKAVCVCAFILVPSIVFCFFPQLVSALLLLWGAIILLHDLFGNKNFTKSVGSILLLLFTLGYVVTLILYAKEDLISTFNVFCWSIIQFFLLFAIDRREKKSVKELFNELYFINVPIVIVMLISGLLSLLCFFMKLAVVMPDPEGLNKYWAIGIVNGRNSGIFNNPIPCASAMFIGCVASMWNFFHSSNKRSKLFYIISFIVGFLCIQTTLTRTYGYGIYFVVAIAAFVGCFQLFRTRFKSIKRFVTSLGIMLLAVGLVVAVGQVTKKGLVYIVEKQEVHSVILNAEEMEGFGEHADKEEIQQQISDSLALDTDVTLSRDEISRLPSFFYPRNELWKVALQVIPHSPVFGFSTGNLAASSLEYGHTEYFSNNWKSGIPTYHNAYVDIAVAAGLLGLCLMLVFLGLQIVQSLRAVFGKCLHYDSWKECFGYGILIAFLAVHVCFISLFFGTLTFCNLAVCLYFWIVLGYISRVNEIILPAEKRLSIENFYNAVKKVSIKHVR